MSRRHDAKVGRRRVAHRSGHVATLLAALKDPYGDGVVTGVCEVDEGPCVVRVDLLCTVRPTIAGNTLRYRLPEGRWASARHLEPVGPVPPSCR